MTQTKTRRSSATRKRAGTSKTASRQESEVLTLQEAAAYLRVAPEELPQMVAAHGLPGRQFGAEWRFFKAALQAWLSAPTSAVPKNSFWQTHFAALKDDPYREEMLAEIFRKRGRPETEDR